MESISFNARMMTTDPNIIQLYSAATPNGKSSDYNPVPHTCNSPIKLGLKVAIALEEIKTLRGMTEIFDYEPHTVNIRAMENRKPIFETVNPNGKVFL